MDKDILEILCCPACRGDLKLSDDDSFLICKSCGLMYRIEDDIPILLVEEAKKDDKR